MKKYIRIALPVILFILVFFINDSFTLFWVSIFFLIVALTVEGFLVDDFQEDLLRKPGYYLVKTTRKGDDKDHNFITHSDSVSTIIEHFSKKYPEDTIVLIVGLDEEEGERLMNEVEERDNSDAKKDT